jgi:hypothetical protein
MLTMRLAVSWASNRLEAVATSIHSPRGALCVLSCDGSPDECVHRHGSKFDVRNGAVISGPARVPQQLYTTRIKGDIVEVKLAPPATSTWGTECGGGLE